MKINDLVSIRISRGHFVGFGVLTEIDLRAGTGVVMRDGKRYERSLKRIKTFETGKAENAKKIVREQKRMGRRK